MILHNTRESAIRRDEFHRVLHEWLDDTFDGVVGEADHHSGTAWLWVRHGGDHYCLDGSATRDGVREYLRLVELSDDDVQWQIHLPASGPRERVAVGPVDRSILGFDFYRHMPKR